MLQMPDSPRAAVLTVLNLKGGVGKTHTSWLLAGVCQERGKRYLAVDCDPQGNLTTSFVAGERTAGGFERLFDPSHDPLPDGLVRRTAFTHIDLIPASLNLARFDVSDQRHWEAADLQLSLTEAVKSWRPTYDYVVFDCPPRLSLVSYAALCASDYVIVPLEAADWGAQGIIQVTAAIEHVRQHYNPRLRLLGYLVSRFKKARVVQQSYVKQLREHFGDLAMDTMIPDLASFEQSVVERTPVVLRPRSHRAAGIARDFFAEVERRIADHESRGRGDRPADLRQPAAIAA
jgi:chromosome partitioning protein